MRTSRAGIEAIKQFEGCVLGTYRCAAGVPTIGYGHTGHDVAVGQYISRDQAEALLVSDLVRFERAVEEAARRPMTQGQFDAMVSLAFNIGAEAFRKSTLVRKFNEGDTAGAGQQFVVWHKVAGQLNAGLLQRRAAELWMFARGSAA